MALVAAFLNAVFGLCLGCELYLLGSGVRCAAATDGPTRRARASVDERLRAVGQRLLDEHGGARDPDARQHVVGADAARGPRTACTR